MVRRRKHNSELCAIPARRLLGEANLYNALARYYDQIYHWKDYEKESRTIKRLIRSYKKSPGKSLLDVACGTGRHVQYLKDDFRCIGIDASEEMLAVARRKVHGVRFARENMISFDLGRRFDVVLCLFSSMGYLRTRGENRKAILSFARHVKPGGVLLVEPWVRKSDWRDGTVHMQTYDSEPLKIARVNFSRAKGKFSILEEGYLIAEKSKGVTYLRDRHKMRFFELGPTLKAMREAGLDAKFREESLMPGRGLLIATKPR